jgi:hypothetical protein
MTCFASGAGRSIQDSTANYYLKWIRRFRIYCAQRKLDERAELTLVGVHRFTAWYSRRHHRNLRYLGNARSALYALTRVYQVMGLSLPEWQAENRAPRLAHRRGSAEYPNRTVLGRAAGLKTLCG